MKHEMNMCLLLKDLTLSFVDMNCIPVEMEEVVIDVIETFEQIESNSRDTDMIFFAGFIICVDLLDKHTNKKMSQAILSSKLRIINYIQLRNGMDFKDPVFSQVFMMAFDNE